MQKHVLQFPERLRFNEVDSVLRFVALALSRIEFELHRFFVSASTSKRRLLLQRRIPRREMTQMVLKFSGVSAAGYSRVLTPRPGNGLYYVQ